MQTQKLYNINNYFIHLGSVSKQTFQSVLSNPFNREGVIFPLISSRGKPSNPPADVNNVDSDALTVFFGTADAPSNGFFSYSASSALRSAGLTSARKPLMSAEGQSLKPMMN